MNISSLVFLVLLVAAAGSPVLAAARPAPQVRVDAEEDVYSYAPADNGAGPMWCGGSTCLVRIGQDVLASGLETLKAAKPLNNCRWMLFKRGTGGWELQQSDPAGRTREPCPIVGFPGGPLLLSANPTLVKDPEVRAGPARPEILQFSPTDAKAPFTTMLPQWQGAPAFSEHSYRSFAADGPGRELILFQNIGYTHAEWAFRDAKGNWAAQGKLEWPWGAEYEKPQPIRVCYPNVMLRERAVHFAGVSDIVEPNMRWREYKKKLTGQEWDYDFRRLFYTWTPDIMTGKFSPWVEIASREKTCGWMMPGDLWVGPDGNVHILWTERAIDERLRQEFFPGQMQRHELNYAVVRDGKAVSRRPLVAAAEGAPAEIPGTGRFHVTPEGRLLVFYYVSGRDAAGKRVSENRLMELYPDGTSSPPVRVPLQHPMNSYFTATVRGGSPPSNTLELLGQRAGVSGTISYAKMTIE